MLMLMLMLMLIIPQSSTNVSDVTLKEQIPRRHRAMMRDAMDHISSLVDPQHPLCTAGQQQHLPCDNQTLGCITFIPASNFSHSFVTILPGPNCSSEVGMMGGEQLLYMNARCFANGLIVPVRQLMRTLGFAYEHNRTLVLAGSGFVWTMLFKFQTIPLHWIQFLDWAHEIF